MTTTSLEKDYIKPNGRDLRLDFMRGLFIFIMVVDHISGNSPLYYITFGNGFFTGAVEGFLLISGLVSGLVYSKVIQRNGIGAGLIKSVHRFLVTYLITISLSLIVIFFGEHFHFFYSQERSLAQPIPITQQLMTFNLSYFYVDVLIIFCLLFLLLPYALILLDAGKTVWLCAISLGIYVFYIMYPESTWIHISTFINFNGVQLFFISGLVLGYHHVLERIQARINKKALIFSGVIFLILFMLWHFMRYPGELRYSLFTPQVVDQLWLFFDKLKVFPGRFFASAIVFSFLYLLLTLYWNKIDKVLGWLLLPLGENSLFAYSFHVIFVMVFLLMAKFLHYAEKNYWLNALIQLTGVFSIWFCIKKKLFTPEPHNRKIYFALPAIITVTFIVVETMYRIPLIHSNLAPILQTILP